MLETSAAFRPAITGTARRMHIRVPIRITAQGLTMGTLTPSAGMISRADGTFAEPQTVTQEFSGVTALQNLVLTFPEDGYPVELTVAILSNESEVYRQELRDNAEPRVELSGFTVYYPDTVTITATRLSAAGKTLSVEEVLPGYADTWTEDDITELSVQMQADFSALSLPYGSATLAIDNTDRRFDPQNRFGLFQMLEEGQPIPIELGVQTAGGTEYVPLGTYFQHDEGWRQADAGMTIKWSLVDICGLIAAKNFIPPSPLPETMGGWLTAILSQLGQAFAGRVIVDEITAGMAMTAAQEDVSGKSCGDILCWLCQASGTYPRADAATGHLRIARVADSGNLYLLDNLSAKPSHAVNDRVGTITFTLSQDETVTLGGNASFVQQSADVQNPFITEHVRAVQAAQNILAGYGGMKISLSGRGDPSSEIGDRAALEIGERQYLQGWIKSQTFEFSGGIMKDCKTELLQSDGFAYAYSATLTASGLWIAPRGASSLRVILVGGGEYGAAEEGGAGGKIWFGTIPINRGQRFDVIIGEGGTSTAPGGQTIFGAYTSDSGERFDPCYTDAISGLDFGRANVARPPWHSGDGGAQGVNGGSGTIILYWNLDPEWFEGEWYFAGDIFAGEAQA